MLLLFDGTVRIQYRQFYVESREPGITAGSAIDAYAGQRNGMCGAATPGFLYLNTGKNSGYVTVRVERHDIQPPIDDVWEDIVEVSFHPETSTAQLMQWAAEERWPLNLEQQHYRVRYNAHGMDFSDESADEPDEHYLLQFWPAPPRPDRIVRQETKTAAHLNTGRIWSPKPGRYVEP
ncbi:hypothetical protein Dvina_19305 [Dactylosporangium vinaceum]|uniref:RES domain-containing protein n=1 Tax=Dactylosporangium vinaceum TaxID=53362 RepID=A0ABV5M9I4_9ACTN|nr:hypothetical protein [Dactylosporangium vinaceum]UAC00012.1 hypothetical protein Dvina_19305 [Dactylosporangium vinaceum]